MTHSWRSFVPLVPGCGDARFGQFHPIPSSIRNITWHIDSIDSSQSSSRDLIPSRRRPNKKRPSGALSVFPPFKVYATGEQSRQCHASHVEDLHPTRNSYHDVTHPNSRAINHLKMSFVDLWLDYAKPSRCRKSYQS
jgi:hypothetical protein